MKKLLLFLLLTVGAFGQTTPWVEATAAQTAAGTLGPGYAITPRRLSGGNLTFNGTDTSPPGAVGITSSALPQFRTLYPTLSTAAEWPVVSTLSTSSQIASAKSYTYSSLYTSALNPFTFENLIVAGLDGQVSNPRANAATSAIGESYPYGMSFSTDSAHVVIQHYDGAGTYQFFVDGAEASPLISSGNSALAKFVQLTFPDARPRRITVWGLLCLSVDVDLSATIWKSENPGDLTVVFGDSETEGTGASDSWHVWSRALGRMLNWDVQSNGLGGAGLYNNGGSSGKYALYPRLSQLTGGTPVTWALAGGGTGYSTYAQYEFWSGGYGATATVSTVDALLGVATFTQGAAGTGYAVGDDVILVPDSGNGTSAVFTVTAVNGSGGITAMTLKLPGCTYGAGNLGRLRKLGGTGGIVYTTTLGGSNAVSYANTALRSWGSGYTAGEVVRLVPSTATSSGTVVTTFATATVSSVFTQNPKRVVIAVGQNDGTISTLASSYTTTYLDAVRAKILALTSAHPLDEIIWTGGFHNGAEVNGGGNPPATNTGTYSSRISAYAASKGDIYLDTLYQLTGTGRAGGLQNDGNSDLYVASDNAHMNGNAGHAYWAQSLAQKYLAARTADFPVNAVRTLPQPRLIYTAQNPEGLVLGYPGDLVVRADTGAMLVKSGGTYTTPTNTGWATVGNVSVSGGNASITVSGTNGGTVLVLGGNTSVGSFGANSTIGYLQDGAGNLTINSGNETLRLYGGNLTVTPASSNLTLAGRNIQVSFTSNTVGNTTSLAGGTTTAIPIMIGTAGTQITGNGTATLSLTGALAGITTITSSGNHTFTGNSTGIVGNTTGGVPGSGIVGYVLSSLVPTGSAVTLTSTVTANVTTLTLTPGTWNLSGSVNVNEGVATVTATVAGISTAGAVMPTDGSEVYSGALVTGVTAIDGITIPIKQVTVTANTTASLVVKQTFSVGTETAFGQLKAERAY